MTTTAILARTNAQLAPLQELLYSAGLKFYVLGKASFYAQSEIKKILHAIKEHGYGLMPANHAVESAIQKTNILRYCQNYAEIDNSPLANIEQLQKIAAKFKTGNDLLDHARKVQHASRKKNGVALGSIHSAKGLEFDTVFVIGCQELLIPHKNSDNLSEELNILFVALSRAAKKLIVTYSGTPSRWIKKFVQEKPSEETPFVLRRF